MYRLPALLALVVLLSSCIGAIDQAALDEEVQRRGGGVSSAWITDSFDLIAEEVAAPSTAELDVISLTILPRTRTVTADVRRGDRPDAVDTVVINDRMVIDVSPMEDAASLAMDESVIPLGSLPFDRIDDLVVIALNQFDEPGAHVSSVGVSLESGRATVRLQVVSETGGGIVRFDAAGRLAEVRR